jgi:predicted GNAT family acetyltransferase
VDDRVVDNPQAQRFELYQGEEVAGRLEYDLDGDRLDLLHTEVSPRFEGQGLGGKLARHALDDARTRGRQVRPYCNFVRDWIEKHPDYLDLVPEPERARFGL